MVKLSTKGRYGLRCMVDLALNAERQHVPLASIADRQGLSILYLEQVFSALRKAGLVKSVKGAGGGYSLARPAEEITAGEVLRALEGDLSLLGTSARDADTEESLLERCLRAQLWSPIDEAVFKIVDGLTLEGLASEAKRMASENVIAYYI